ncbi:hypothetical protein, partial [uncultured Oscillibacter sp.]|uniref:hypothetical protein n=1 Tax=uncultured Oscillibacter sp. TaxID=876091 RepID=UPI00261B0676
VHLLGAPHLGGAPFAAIHAGFVPGILYIQLSVGGLSLLTYQAGYKHNSQAASANSQKILSVFIIWKGRDANGTNYQKISSK